MTVRATAVDQMIRRSVSFVDNRLGRVGSREITDIRPAEELPSETSERRYLSIVEMSLPRPQIAGKEYDHLIVMMLTPPRQDGSEQSGPLTVLVPENLRSASRESRTTFFVNDLVVVPDAGPFESVAVFVYAIVRNASAARLIASLHSTCEALDESGDYLHALSLSQAVMDRIEVLEQSGNAEIVLAGRISALGGGSEAGPGTRFAALVDEQIATGGDQHWWVRGSSLQVGTQADSAQPVTRGSYLLLRYGERSTQSSVRRYIEELRRRHALKREELRAGEKGEAYRNYVEKEVERRRQRVIDALYGQHTMLPVTTPIEVEAASNLESVVALGSDPDTELQTLINAMREEFHTIYGVSVPGLRVRLNESDLTDGTYIIMINEVPLVSGNIALEQQLCDETVDRLSLLNIKGEEAPHPGDGHDCSWIPREQAELARSAGITIWGPTDYLILHLESVLRKNLGEFMGIDELVSGLGDDAKAREELLNRLASARGGIARFRNVIVALLNEELPARPLPVLARQYLERIDKPAYDIAEEFRLVDEINTHLLQDAEKWWILTLADDYVELIQQHIMRREDAAILALEPEPTQEALTAVRNELDYLPSDKLRPVILVEDWRVRPFVKKLIELEFTQVKVVARREVEKIDTDRLQPKAIIGLK
jgi:hypothetical protein